MKSTFVARRREFSELNALLQSALAGQGQVAFVLGEAGQGKTALLQAFVQQAQRDCPELLVVGGNCNAYTGIGDPYLPFREILAGLTGCTESQLGVGDCENMGDRLSQFLPLVAQALLDQGIDLIDTFIPSQRLLKPVDEPSALTDWQRQLSQQLQRPRESNIQQKALFEQYTRVLQVLSLQAPLVLWLDDLQWADGGSTSLLFHLGRRIQGHRIFMLGAYRPAEVALGREGERHPLESIVNEFQRMFGHILFDLSQAEGRSFINELLDSEPNDLGETFRETLYRQTDGHPLFTLELLRDMQELGNLFRNESGAWVARPQIDWTTLPARVEGAIAQRISRLERPLQELLQVASVEGEDFTAEVVAQVLNVDSREVVRRLSQELDKMHRIVRPLGIRTDGSVRLSRYRFRHILIQRYLYNSLDDAERVYLNEAIGTAIEQIHGEQANQLAVHLARYFQEAARSTKAIGYLIQAGRAASQVSAHAEAIAHLNQALSLLNSSSPDAIPQELEIRTVLGPVLMMTEGQSSFQVGANYTRAWNLCQSVHDAAQKFPILWGLWRFQLNRAKLKLSRDLAEQLVDLTQELSDTAWLIEARMALGTSLLYMGMFSEARSDLEQARAAYNHEAHAHLAFYYGGYDPAVYSIAYAPFYLWMQGYPDQALTRSQEVISFARALAHPYSLIFALYCNELYQYCRQDIASLQQRAEESIALCNEYEIPLFRTIATFLQGWIMVLQQHNSDGFTLIQEGLTAYEAAGSGLIKPMFLSLLADAYETMEDYAPALETLTEALSMIQQTDERVWEAEVHRRIGELLMKHPRLMSLSQKTPEDYFIEAIAIAQRQTAKSLELRATLSLCTLWQAQGKIQEGRSRLSAIYSWFTEGFETPDLQAAKTLLDELGGVLQESLSSSSHESTFTEPAAHYELSVNRSASAQSLPSRPELPGALDRLTEREQEILELVAQGLSNAQISEQLFLSPKTVKNHITHIFSKMQVNTRAEAIVRARTAGFGTSVGL